MRKSIPYILSAIIVAFLLCLFINKKISAEFDKIKHQPQLFADNTNNNIEQIRQYNEAFDIIGYNTKENEVATSTKSQEILTVRSNTIKNLYFLSSNEYDKNEKYNLHRIEYDVSIKEWKESSCYKVSETTYSIISESEFDKKLNINALYRESIIKTK